MMNIPKMTEDVNNISNQPNRVIGKASDLKKTFDKSGKDIKNYLNTILIPALEELISGKIDKNSGKVSELVNDGNGLSPFATVEQLFSEIAGLVDSSPDALNTLKELADALGNDPNFATTVINHLASKVDKVYGKGLSSNDYTNEDKNKLEGLPDNKTLQALLSKKPEIITYSKDEAYFDNYLSDGIYFFICEDGDVYSIETLYVWQEFDTVYQLRECKGRKTKREYYENRWSRWTEYEVPFTHADKVKLDDLEKSTRDNFEGVWLDIESIVAELIKTDEKIGDINTALDELHNYAQGLIGGDS